MRRERLLSYVLGCALLIAIASAGNASAAEGPVEHVFDAARSLRGNCSTSEVDPIPDPGLCPMPPGVPGVDHPLKAFNNPCGVATDNYGDLYVANEAPKGAEGRIDVFDANGDFLAEVPEEKHPCGVAVDSEGTLFVLENEDRRRVIAFSPSSYPPQPGAEYELSTVVYQTPPVGTCGEAEAITVDPSDDHLYVRKSCQGISEYGSSAENPSGEEWTAIREEIGNAIPHGAINGDIDVFGRNHDIYVTGVDFNFPATEPEAQRVYVLDGSTGQVICESNGPAGGFSFIFGNGGIAVDQSTGEFYVDDSKVNGVIDRFGADCEFVDQLPSPQPIEHPDLRAGLAVDNPCMGEGEAPCNLGGYHSPSAGYVFVGTGQTPTSSRVFAFKPKLGGPPIVEEQSVSGITETEAVLRAELNPSGLETFYRFEYISQADFEADGDEYGAGAVSLPAVDASAGSGGSFVNLTQPVTGLQPGTAYRFRLVASNCAAPDAVVGECESRGEGNPGGEGEDLPFSTFGAEADALPDDRGYELVTPGDTNGYTPTMSELGPPTFGANVGFPTDFAGPGGDSVLFAIEGGSLPSLPSNGFHDTYEAHRQPNGTWTTGFNGVNGTETSIAFPGGFSPDHSASFWSLEDPGQDYILRSGGVLDSACALKPGSHMEVIGCGSLGTDPVAIGNWISAGAGHVIFSSKSENARIAQHLEPDAAPTGTDSIYDRTPDGITHVISLKPGDIPFGEGEKAEYVGVSDDGTAVAFEVNGTLFVRRNNSETLEVTAGKPRFAGLSADGSRIVYMEPNATNPFFSETKIPQGNLFVCDLNEGPCAGPGSHAAMAVGAGGKSVLVNVSADGSHLFFVSPEALDGEGQGKAGENNLYVWANGSIRFIAAVEHADVAGRPGNDGDAHVGGLGLWITDSVSNLPRWSLGPGNDPARSTPDGSAFVFESHANLTGYPAAGHSEIYRYDEGGQLSCLSCAPTGVPARSDAQLQADFPPQFTLAPPINALARIANITSNGLKVFFQSGDQLVRADTDGKDDVYEWEASGQGGCSSSKGCLHLISSPRSAGNEYLYGMTPDGSNVFFQSGELLVPEDIESTPSVYDAREGGGAPPAVPPASECLGEACQPPAVAPSDSAPASLTYNGPGNQKQKHCKKNRKKHCGKHHKKHHRRHHRQTKRTNHHGRAGR